MTIVHKLAICSPAAILLLPILFCGCTEKSTEKVVERETRVTVQPLEKRIFRHQIPVQGTVTPVDHAERWRCSMCRRVTSVLRTRFFSG